MEFLNSVKNLAHIITPSGFNRSSDLTLGVNALRFYYRLISLQCISIMLKVWRISCYAHYDKPTFPLKIKQQIESFGTFKSITKNSTMFSKQIVKINYLTSNSFIRKQQPGT